jgi:hypothetical protein
MYDNGYYASDKANEFVPKRGQTFEERGRTFRSYNRQWDYIVCTICVGCGKPLGRYENLSRLAFCRSCREILFPETVRDDESREKRFSNRRRDSW